jgi:hypothetical protein
MRVNQRFVGGNHELAPGRQAALHTLAHGFFAEPLLDLVDKGRERDCHYYGECISRAKIPISSASAAGNSNREISSGPTHRKSAT